MNASSNNQSKQKILKTIYLIGIPIIVVLIIVFATKFFDNKMIDKIEEELSIAEDMLEDFLADEETLPVFMTANIIEDIKAEINGKTVFNSDGVVENVDSNQDYYGLPAIISVYLNSKFEGKFLSDENRNVYYIHNRKIK